MIDKIDGVLSMTSSRAGGRFLPLVSLLALLLLALAITDTAKAAISAHETSKSSNVDAGASSLTINKPANVAAGNFMLAQVTFEKGTEITIDLTALDIVPPTGWVLVARRDRGTDIGQAIYRKVAHSSEPASYTWTFRKGTALESVRASGGIVRYTGVDQANPVVGTPTGNTGDSTTLTALSVAANADLVNSMLVAFFGIKKFQTLTDPTGMTELYFQQHANSSGPTIKAARQTLTSAAAPGDRVSTASTTLGADKWVAQQVALRAGNTPPEYTPPADQTANEGENKSFNLGSFTDPDSHAKWTITVDWGDSSTPSSFDVLPSGTIPGTIPAQSHTYADNGTYDVTVTVDDGVVGPPPGVDSGTFAVTVANVAPTVTAAADQTADEGEDKSFDLGSFSDPGVNDADWAVSVDWGDGSTPSGFDAATQGSLGSLNHTYPDDDPGPYTVTVQVTDKDGGVDSDTFEVAVGNLAPTVAAAANQAVDQDAPLTVDPAATFDDPGFDNPGHPGGATEESFTATIDWGDGNVDNVTPTWSTGSPGSPSTGSVAGTHTYTTPGSKTVTVEVCDDDLGCDDDTFLVEVTATTTPPDPALTDYALLGNHDVEISGSADNIHGDIHSNRNIKISGSSGVICGDMTAVGTIRNGGSQCDGHSSTQGAPPVTLPVMADHVPPTSAATHILSGDRSLNGYTCTMAGGCIVWVKGKLEIRGTVSGNVWFLADKEAIVKGTLGPANTDSSIKIYSKLNVESPTSKVTVEASLLAERELKLGGSDQKLVGLFWGRTLVDLSGSRIDLTGAVISERLLKVSGSGSKISYDASVIGL